MEMIHLRLAVECPDDLAQAIRRAAAGQSGAHVTVYRHSGVSTDLGIFVSHDEDGSGEPSAMGVRLASELRQYGMVEHSVWKKWTDPPDPTPRHMLLR
jgi:hypothetical protein